MTKISFNSTRLHVASALLAALLGLSACKSKSSELATVNGKAVKQAEFDAFLRLKHIAASDQSRRDRALDEYLEREALAGVIEKEAKLDRELIDAELRETKKELVISRYFDRFLDEKVTDEAIKNYYEANAKNYEQRKVHVAHILVRTNRKMADEERKAKLTAIQEIHGKLGTGQSFEELARSLSEDKISGAKGGDLGWLREGSIDAEFSKRAFSMKAGSVSEPFETSFGFHVIKVIEEPAVVRKPYAAVLGDIRHQLRTEARQAELERLKRQMTIAKKGSYRVDPKAPAPSAAAARAAATPVPSGAVSVSSAVNPAPPKNEP